MILRAKWVLPVGAAPIENGAVAVEAGRITAVGRAGEMPGGVVRDLGESVLFPGLINAHCHLDYTGMRGLVPWRGDFMDWILQLVALKKQWKPADYLASIKSGMSELVRGGTTTVVNIECFPELVARVEPTALRVWWCPELIDLTWSEESRRMAEEAERWLESQPCAGLSPHAPYTASAPLYRLAAGMSRKHGWLLTTHAAESREEDEMFRWERGAMFERYRWGYVGGAVRYLEGAGVLGKNCLLAHANFVTLEEAWLLSRAGASVVHCPRTHRFFGREAAPLKTWSRAGVNVCLGTDSAASNESLDMRAEMREMARAWPGMAPREIVEMATLNGARALNCGDKLGRITSGAEADLVAVGAGDGAGDPWETVVCGETSVRFVMIGGKAVLDEKD